MCESTIQCGFCTTQIAWKLGFFASERERQYMEQCNSQFSVYNPVCALQPSHSVLQVGQRQTLLYNPRVCTQIDPAMMRELVSSG